MFNRRVYEPAKRLPLVAEGVPPLACVDLFAVPREGDVKRVRIEGRSNRGLVSGDEADGRHIGRDQVNAAESLHGDEIHIRKLDGRKRRTERAFQLRNGLDRLRDCAARLEGDLRFDHERRVPLGVDDGGAGQLARPVENARDGSGNPEFLLPGRRRQSGLEAGDRIALETFRDVFLLDLVGHGFVQIRVERRDEGEELPLFVRVDKRVREFRRSAERRRCRNKNEKYGKYRYPLASHAVHLQNMFHEASNEHLYSLARGISSANISRIRYSKMKTPMSGKNVGTWRRT